jgi:hypothetical protein
MTKETKDPVCTRCGYGQSDHLLVNYSEMQTIGMATLLCPNATFSDDSRVLVPVYPNPSSRRNITTRDVLFEKLEALIAENVEVIGGVGGTSLFCHVCLHDGPETHTNICPVLKLWEMVEDEKRKTRNTRGC